MFAFAAYAIAVWYAAARFRRRWQGFAWIVAGAAGLILVAYLHWQLNIWTEGRIHFRVLQAMLYPYTLLVVGIALYIACLPRRRPVAHECFACRYDLAGLVDETALCPECGANFTVAARLSPAADATPCQAGAPLPGGPRWSASGSPVACHHSADG